MNIDTRISASQMTGSLDRLFDLAVQKVRLLDREWDASLGTPVFTANGTYTTRGWTEWTQGFQFGCAILAFDATGEKDLLELGRKQTLGRMAPHVTHIGVHDHGFNNLSTYGNLCRLIREGRFEPGQWERDFYEMAIKASGAVQAARWAEAQDGGGYVYSFNGPHSLFIDTMRTIRVLGVAHQLGHYLAGENDRHISLLGRLVTHGLTTARWNIYYGEGRDSYDQPDLRGRTVHEAIFNRNDGRFRCPSSQQGYSPFTTWTRGLAWAILGFAEELEFLQSLAPAEFTRAQIADKASVLATFEQAARATADFYIDQATAADGIPYWDTGAPGLPKLEDWQSRPAEPFNDHEPVDSSAAAIAAQGLLRLGRYLGANGTRYFQAGLNVTKTLLAEPYLSTAPRH
ncbi:MAG TPA: hypothetical protein VHY37_08155, partial [Tepidisphaeraceae bacterium]|nr:hypothetical protein [Tepidisphaeraceae bacterium]